MRMIERGTVGRGFEGVCETSTRRYGAHRNTRYSVCPFRVLLVDTMPMHRSTLGRPRYGILHRDFNGISPIRFDQRLAIEP